MHPGPSTGLMVALTHRPPSTNVVTYADSLDLDETRRLAQIQAI